MTGKDTPCAQNQINPTEEESYWRQQHSRQPYAGQSRYEDYQGAYRMGYEGCARFQGRSFQQCEPELRRDYEKTGSKSNVPWEKARDAARAAWSRADRNLGRFFVGYEVVDRQNNKSGRSNASGPTTTATLHSSA